MVSIGMYKSYVRVIFAAKLVSIAPSANLEKFTRG